MGMAKHAIFMVWNICSIAEINSKQKEDSRYNKNHILLRVLSDIEKGKSK